ncbi:MAG: hypothetical protein IT202_05285 [Fimbriimonadaceae bacterium]|nr:hypothetical protein [Fimbriimonadaceae bacterium]
MEEALQFGKILLTPLIRDLAWWGTETHAVVGVMNSWVFDEGVREAMPNYISPQIETYCPIAD